MEIMYERFVERHNEFMDREAPEYLRLSREVSESMGEGGEGMSTRAFLHAQIKRDQASARIVRQLTAIEHEFIAGLEPVLSDDQLDRLEIPRLEARRRNCRVLYWCYSRWADIELRKLWADQIAALATPAERAVAEGILAEYEATLTGHVCQYADAFFRTRKRLTEHRIPGLR